MHKERIVILVTVTADYKDKYENGNNVLEWRIVDVIRISQNLKLVRATFR